MADQARAFCRVALGHDLVARLALTVGSLDRVVRFATADQTRLCGGIALGDDIGTGARSRVLECGRVIHFAPADLTGSLGRGQFGDHFSAGLALFGVSGLDSRCAQKGEGEDGGGECFVHDDSR